MSSPTNGKGKDKVERKKRVLIVGAGAAGMSCAHHLAQHPDKFDITLVDAVDYCGGQAFTIDIDKEKHGASWLNQGVQGGSYIFHHTMTMFARQGHHADPVELQVSFGKDETFWTNVFPTELLAKHQKEIKRFAWMLRIVRRLELVFALLPIKYLLKLFFFSSEFTNTIVLPMVALFLGTGNATPEVPSIIVERLCTSPTYGMWYPPDELSVASNLPPMVVFPRFGSFYEAWRRDLVGRGVKVRLSTEVTGVVKRDKTGVTVRTVKRTPAKDGHNPNSAWVPHDAESNADAGAKEVEEEYDELVLCVLADTAKRILSRTSSFRERKVLGAAKFSDDITVTHTDAAYMKKHYTNTFTSSVPTLSGVSQSTRNAFGSTSFKPMYLIKTYPSSRSKLEMCFDCTNYQSQFPPSVPFENHVFQTIFLNKSRDSHLWTIDDIAPDKVIRRDWWHQLCHSWTHYLFVVPFVFLLQGRRRTRFAGAWTLVNAHEVAVISGIAAAVDLGARYPEDLERDGFALLCFRLYYLLAYGKWYKRRLGKGEREGEGKDWGSGVYGSVYGGPGVSGRERLTWREENGVED
ncbi:FAD/NAD(P)-binding domain-containing protein [Aaosphaeria arxii CBS 175.79]|uniref:FAD/NAD(P)-binding domain-containing protein n=1 Tax=Aaosphaeria arxii CBS 175.79 TaxID=1450172 RepID=A0A6A5YAB7_9PLEO|nr:FAD/NAD(P)-binding domain-containing protein [Aaosphaeria arxii CBS 175.79]KAF2022163.1 FAD/NAD(P)-binding domain-containing protein [Aaosphaeria arxii CBS 175.79]